MDRYDRRFKDNENEAATIIGKGITIKGELSGKRNVIVLGEFHGNCQLDNMLVVDQVGKWHGSITANNAVINGEVEGNVTVSDKLEIGETGKINGNVTVGFIAIARGAVIDGDITTISNKKSVNFVEKRK